MTSRDDLLSDTMVEQLAAPVDAPAIPAAPRVPAMPLPRPSTPLFPTPPSQQDLLALYGPMEARPAPKLTDSIVSALAAAAPMPEVRWRFEGASTGWRVRRFRATEGLSQLYEIEVELAHDVPDEDPEALFDAVTTVRAARGAHERRFVGRVRRVENLNIAHGHRVARVFIVPELWALTQRVDSRIFQDKTAIEVVQDVLRRAGLYAGKLDLRLQGTYLTREYCVQHRERDFDFVARLLAEEGVAFHFEHEDDGERLVLSDHAEAFGPIETFDGAPVPIAGAESQTMRTEPVRFFERARTLEPTSATVRDFDFTRPRFDVKGTDARGGGARPTYEFQAPVVLAGYSGNAYSQDNAEAQAAKRAMLYAHRDQRAQGHGAVTTFTPGFTFELTGHNVASLDRRYVVVRVVHEGAAPEELTEGTQHDDARVDRYRNTFECAPADRMIRPERATPRPTIAGVQTATVVGPAGEEIYTDVHGRIKVQFHWDREGRRDERSSCWIRSMQPWGGPGWGFVFIPRIGMEVVVSFVEGDPDRPLVIGSVYNGENGTPYPQPDQKTRSTLKTNSSPGGGGYNELRFEDAAGSEEIYLQAQKDFNELVKHNHTTTVQNDQTNAVTCNQTETVGGDQSMTVTGDRTKTIHGNETVTVDKDRVETVHQNEVLTVDLNRVHVVHGAESLTVDRTRTLLVTGKDTETLDGSRETTVNTLDKLTVNGKREVFVHGEYNTTADTQFHVTQKSDHLFIKDSVDLKSVGTLKLHNGKTSVEMTDGGVITLTAANEIKLVCGSSSISLKKDGTVTLNGAKEVAAGSGPSSVRVEPSGVNSAGPKINSAAIGVHEISGALIKIN